MKRQAWVIDPRVAPDAWSRRSLEQRIVAVVTGRCPECGALERSWGFDYRGGRRNEMVHATTCRVSTEALQEHLAEVGLDLGASPAWLVVEFERPEEAAE